MNLYPIMVNLEGRTVAIVGAGGVALRKARDLLDSGAAVRVISPRFHEGFASLRGEFTGRIECLERPYRRGDLEGAMLVFSATSSPEVNALVFAEAMERNILINAVDDPPNCSFYIPSFVRRGDLIMTLSTSGASPSMAARLRRQLQEHIPDNIEDVLASLRSGRELLKSHGYFSSMSFEERGAVLKSVVNDDVLLDRLCAAYRENRLPEFLKDLAETQ
jgi:precorrin-2 dehydrogenase/sirohydrochlorin ferrochelatase